MKNSKKQHQTLLTCHFILILFCLGIIINFINFKFDSNAILKISTENYSIPHINGTALTNDVIKIIYQTNYSLHFDHINIIEQVTKVYLPNNTYINTNTSTNTSGGMVISQSILIKRLNLKSGGNDPIYEYYKGYSIILNITIISSFILILLKTLFFMYFASTGIIKNKKSGSNGEGEDEYIIDSSYNKKNKNNSKVIKNVFKISLLTIIIPMMGFSVYLIFNPLDNSFKQSFRDQVKVSPILKPLCFDINDNYFGICEFALNGSKIEDQERLIKYNLNLKDKTKIDKDYIYIWEKYTITMSFFYYKLWFLGVLVMFTSIMMAILFALSDRKILTLKTNNNSILNKTENHINR